MGIIKEPKGINFTVDPRPISAQDRKDITEIIAHYKLTGKKIRKTTVTLCATKSKRKKVTITQKKLKAS